MKGSYLIWAYLNLSFYSAFRAKELDQYDSLQIRVHHLVVSSFLFSFVFSFSVDDD